MRSLRSLIGKLPAIIWNREAAVCFNTTRTDRNEKIQVDNRHSRALRKAWLQSEERVGCIDKYSTGTTLPWCISQGSRIVSQSSVPSNWRFPERGWFWVNRGTKRPFKVISQSTRTREHRVDGQGWNGGWVKDNLCCHHWSRMCKRCDSNGMANCSASVWSVEDGMKIVLAMVKWKLMSKTCCEENKGRRFCRFAHSVFEQKKDHHCCPNDVKGPICHQMSMADCHNKDEVCSNMQKIMWMGWSSHVVSFSQTKHKIKIVFQGRITFVQNLLFQLTLWTVQWLSFSCQVLQDQEQPYEGAMWWLWDWSCSGVGNCSHFLVPQVNELSKFVMHTSSCLSQWLQIQLWVSSFLPFDSKPFFLLENLQMLQAMAGIQDVQMSCSSGTRQFAFFSMQRTLFQKSWQVSLSTFPGSGWCTCAFIPLRSSLHAKNVDPGSNSFPQFFVASGQCITSSGEWASKSNSGETMEQTGEKSLMHAWGPMLLATHGVFHALC